MSRRGTRVALLTGVLLCLGGVATAAALLTTTGSARPAQKWAAVSGGFEAKAESLGGGVDNAGGEAQQGLLERAYPAEDIPLSWTSKAQDTWQGLVRATERVTGRPVTTTPMTPSGKRGAPWLSGPANTWQTIGPTDQAVFPATVTYSGARYVTSGRITSMAILPDCTSASCTLLIGAAGGGVWRTTNALAGTPNWTFVSGGFDTNAVGSLYVDPNNPNTIYAGTGEHHASGDSEAGTGIFKSTDGGQTWSKLPAVQTGTGAGCAAPDLGTCTTGASPFLGRSIGSIAIQDGDPNHILATTARGVRGVSAVSGAGVSLNANFPPVGLWESTDGGATWSYAWNANGSLRGAAHVEFDKPHSRLTDVYVSSFSMGIWARRPSQSEPNFVEIFPGAGNADNTDRTEFALTLIHGNTRIYAYEGTAGPSSGGVGPTASKFWRLDNANQPAAVLDASKATGSTPPVVGPGSDYPATYNGWQVLSDSSQSSPFFATYNNCTGQCWYDQYVVTPPGRPDEVYIGGSFSYSEFPSITRGDLFGTGVSNARAVVFSNTAGDPDAANNRRTFTDMTMDVDPGQNHTCVNPFPVIPGSPPAIPPAGRPAACSIAPNIMHPDQHALVLDPDNPSIFFGGSDGGAIRNDGAFTNNSASCDFRGITSPATLLACQRLNSRVPHRLMSMNQGLQTLQFQAFASRPDDGTDITGGTQDNGTWENRATPGGPGGATGTWTEIIDGDGGWSGFDTANPNHRFNWFSAPYGAVNFDNAVEQETHWFIDTGPVVAGGEAGGLLFYPPQIADPVVGGTIFLGARHVWRTKDWGNQAQITNPANNCDARTGDAFPNCGDSVPMGGPAGTNTAGSLVGTFYGADRTGGSVSATERTKADGNSMWAGTSTGRVFFTSNANCGTNTDASCVTWTRIDSLAPNAPNRFVTAIYVDPTNPNRAWVAYGGYNLATPATPGHVFRVDFNPAGPSATFTDLKVEGGTSVFPNTGGGDLPITDLVRDDRPGHETLYASTDFGVLQDPGGAVGTWTLAGSGLPMVEVAGLTLVLPDPLGQQACTSHCVPVLYAATHGRSAFAMLLPQP
jgi:hypothetical protein